MSRPIILLAALSLRALALEGQRASEWRETARRAEAEYRALRDSMLQGDSSVREVARKDDLVIGASADLGTPARDAFGQLIRIRERWFSGQSPVPDGFRIVLRERAYDPAGQIRSNGLVVLSGLPDSGSAIRMDRIAWRGQIGDMVLDSYGEMMIGSLPPGVRAWLDPAIPLSLPEGERRHLVMYAVATGTGASQRGCLLGVAEDCLYALGLARPHREEPGGRYAGLLRTDFLLAALELRPDAWKRLQLAGDKEPILGLSEAAGIPADSLARHWLKGILATRSTEGLLGVRMGLSAIGWIALLLAGMVLGGGSRWV